MSNAMWSGAKSREIVERIVVEGMLVLETPAHFGAGEDDGAVMGLLVDALDGRSPLLTGASIAGALRSYLWARERGYGEKQTDKDKDTISAAALLFGTSRADDRGNGDQSRLIVDDALGQNARVVYRDGVRLDEDSRTAADGALYAVQLWEAGTVFPLRFELLISKGEDREQLLLGLVTALSGLANGEITLGARKRRGYGRVRVDDWRVRRYVVEQVEGLMDWLREGGAALPDICRTDDLAAALGVNGGFADMRQVFAIDAHFTLDGSLLIRATDDVTDNMKYLANSDGQPILSGTSLTGALRARAGKILNTLAQTDTDKGTCIVNCMFGSPHDQQKDRTASRVLVEEHRIEGGVADLVQSRVSIDRFTGGALDSALFDEQPLFGSDESGVFIRVNLQKPEDYEIGLLLLLLKDLWTGDLPLGGERSVGRGRLRGEWAALMNATDGTVENWEIAANGNGMHISTGDAKRLEAYVDALRQKLGVQK